MLPPMPLSLSRWVVLVLLETIQTRLPQKRFGFMIYFFASVLPKHLRFYMLVRKSTVMSRCSLYHFLYAGSLPKCIVMADDKSELKRELNVVGVCNIVKFHIKRIHQMSAIFGSWLRAKYKRYISNTVNVCDLLYLDISRIYYMSWLYAPYIS